MLVLTRNAYKNGNFLGSVEIATANKFSSERLADAIEKDATKIGISAMYSIDLVLNSQFGADCVPTVLAREINAEKAGIRVEYLIKWDSSYIPF